MSIEIGNLLHALNLDRPDIAELPEGATIECNISTLRRVAAYLRTQAKDQPVQEPQIDPAARLTELAESQKRLDDAMAQLCAAIPEREVRALGSRINNLLAAFARASKRESRVDGWQPIDTAPRDGFHILLYRPDICFVGYYAAMGDWIISAPHLPPMYPAPTHWMHLPKAPTTEIEDEPSHD